MMNDSSKTKPELIKEISALRKRIQELEQSETERKRFEDELRFSQQQLRLLIEAGPDFFFLKDVNLRYQLVNSAMAQFFGRDDDDILGRTDFELMPEAAAAACRESDRRAICEKRIMVTIEPVRDRVYETYKFPVMVADEIVGVAGIIRDITGRKQAEEALRESEKRMNTILSNVGAYIFMKDTQYRYTYANSKVCKLFGFKEEEIIGKDDACFFSAASVEEIMKSDRRVIERGETITREETDLTSSDHFPRTYWVVKLPLKDSCGNIYGLCGISTDITERKRAEEALKRSESRLSGIVEFLPDATFAIDLEGKIISWNRAIVEMTGFPADTMLGKGDYEYAIPFYGERRPILVDFLFSWSDDIAKKYSFITKDGDTLYAETDAPCLRGHKRTLWGKASPICNEKGDIIGAIGSIRDITDRKLLESQLLQAQKMEAVGTLAGGVAHDFNNILMGIQGYASLMMLDLDKQHPHYERLKQIEEQVQSASDLTRQLLGFARGGRYEMRPADLNEIIRKSSSMFGRTKKELTVHGKYEKDLWTVEVDRSQIEQILLNLYVNAWHAMPAGGELYLETGNVVLDESYAALHTALPGNYVKVSVTDTGTGMDEETKKRIFDPFFTTKEMGRGTGLGLAMVYGIMKGHKGFVDVHSEPGHGATFTLYLPASEKKALEEARATPEVVRGSETILLVDDEPFVLAVSREILESLGYTVHAKGSGQEGIAFLREMKSNIDLVILDMIMPGLSGSATFDRIRELDPSIKVLLSSGYSLDDQAQQIMDRGCCGFIQKPFNIAGLSRKIREVLEK
jgi:two-component system, cell cycle sensor histidine kinase and response regulator CckA